MRPLRCQRFAGQVVERILRGKVDADPGDDREVRDLHLLLPIKTVLKLALPLATLAAGICLPARIRDW